MINYFNIKFLVMAKIEKTENSESDIKVNQEAIKKPSIIRRVFLFAAITPMIIAFILFGSGLVTEGIIVAFLGSITLGIAACFWKPSRKAAGLLNIVLGILLIFSLIGIPFGIILLIWGGILLFI